MAIYKYRELQPTPNAETHYLEWIACLDTQFSRVTDYEGRAKIVTRELRALFHPPETAGWLSSRVHCDNLDPRNVTLEPEYYGDMDPERYYPRKPLIWFWLQFDRSPLGMNQWLGERFRAMLGKHIFAHIGERVRFFQNVEFSFGYNLSIGDDCWIHRNVLLDDRGGLILHHHTSVSDFANIYTHTHDLRVQADVTQKPTELGPHARITYHATVLAGSRIGEDAMLGAMAVATREVPPHTIALGIPAKVKKEK